MPEGLIEDCEFFDDLQDGELAETDTSLMNNVMQNYDAVLQGGIQKMPSTTSDKDNQQFSENLQTQRLSAKDQIREELGDDLYSQVYDLIIKYRSQSNFDNESEDLEE